jgi:hypothetical protein
MVLFQKKKSMSIYMSLSKSTSIYMSLLSIVSMPILTDIPCTGSIQDESMYLIVPDLRIITKGTRQEKRGRIEQSLSSKKKEEGNVTPSQCKS